MANDTMRIVPVQNHSNAFWMQLDEQVTSEDLTTTFRNVTNALNNASHRVNIIVDLRKDPTYPISTLVSEIMGGPMHHAMMGTWLMLGLGDRRARMVASAVVKIDPRTQIVWVDTEAEALAKLKELEAVQA